MLTKLLLTGTLTAVIGSAAAATFAFDFDNLAATIPDGDLSGYQNSQTVGGLPASLTDVNVTLNLAGGFNGDFYAYLSHNGAIAVLLNRAGRSSVSGVGFPDHGFGPDASSNPMTFDDQATHDVHSYRGSAFSLNASGQLTGQWQSDGRLLDPLAAGSAFDGAARSRMLGDFVGLDPNGTWTLFVADVSAGGEGTLLGWGLRISVVPEPASLTWFGCGLLVGWYRIRARRLVKTPQR